MIPSGHARDKGYLEFDDTRRFGDYDLGPVGTDVRGEGATPRTLEEGVVHKTTDVHQTTRQVLPAVER